MEISINLLPYLEKNSQFHHKLIGLNPFLSETKNYPKSYIFRIVFWSYIKKIVIFSTFLKLLKDIWNRVIIYSECI